MKRFVLEVITNDAGIHTMNVYEKTFWGKKLIQTARDTRAQFALTKVFKGLLSSK